jgi:CRISPR type III-B/RAMP module-associated protein Cmr3
MGQIKYYRCCFSPLGEYFFGGEKNFPFGSQSLSEKKEYYICSEDFPSQSTVFGTIRFMLLEKAGLLDNGVGIRSADPDFREKQNRLIGRKGFSMPEKDALTSYGILEEISPMFLYDKENAKKLLPAPFNHCMKAAGSASAPGTMGDDSPNDISKDNSYETYSPLSVKKLEGVHTDLGEALLPEDYRAKSGLTDAFLALDGKNSLVNREDVIGLMVQTRIARGMEQGGLFKMAFKYLKGSYSFCVMIKVGVPDGYDGFDSNYMPFFDHGIVFMGMEKSTFQYEVAEVDEASYRDLEEAVKKIRMTDRDDVSVYYAASDCYMRTGQKPASLFWILQKKTLRTLERQNGTDYHSSMKKSRLYQMIKAGSVFYVRKDESIEKEFLSQFDFPGLRQIGFNYLIRTEGDQ